MDVMPPKVMVCVTVQKTCERLIRAGSILAKDCDLIVVHVAAPSASLLGEGNDGDALEYLYQAAGRYGAEMHVLRAENVLDRVVSFARENHVGAVVVGRAPDSRSDAFAQALREKLPEAVVHDIAAGDDSAPFGGN